MNVNQRFVVNGEDYQVVSQLGAGGQGAVFKAKNLKTGQFYAVKTINEDDANVKANKIDNIRELVAEKMNAKLSARSASLHVKHVFPISHFMMGKDTLYLMECAPGKSLNSLLKKGEVAKMDRKKKYLLLSRVARSIEILHDFGYIYTDINWGNFMWDESTSTISVIDCENVTSTALIDSGKRRFLKGTDFFMAPEVGFHKAFVSYFSDRYAFAVFAFRLLLNAYIESPYHGKAMYEEVPLPQNTEEIATYEDDDDISPNWKYFIFDENNKSNSLQGLAAGSRNPENVAFRKKLDFVEAEWKTFPAELKDMFIKSFVDPFDTKARPTLSIWRKMFEKLEAGPIVVPPTPKPAPASTPKPVPGPASPVKKKPWEKYKAFVPAGKEAPEVAVPLLNLPDGPILISPEVAISIDSDPFPVDGTVFGLTIPDMGVLQKKGNEYVFYSHALPKIQVLTPDRKVRVELVRGEKATLSPGEFIRATISTKAIQIQY